MGFHYYCVYLYSVVLEFLSTANNIFEIKSHCAFITFIPNGTQFLIIIKKVPILMVGVLLACNKYAKTFNLGHNLCLTLGLCLAVGINMLKIREIIN